MRRVAVLIPALDEEHALPLVLAEIPRDVCDTVLVVDNGSRDRTAEVARTGGAKVVYEPVRGYGQACLSGIAALLGKHADPAQCLSQPLHSQDVVVFLDADHSDYPEEMPALLGPIDRGEADLVIGSRIAGGADMESMLPHAWFGNRLACWLMRILFQASYTDLGPFRAIRCDALEHLRLVDRDFGWTVEMQLKAAVAGLAVREVPVRYRPRIGQSKITGTILGTLRAGWKILGWIIGWRLKLWTTRRGIPRFRGPSPAAR